MKKIISIIAASIIGVSAVSGQNFENYFTNGELKAAYAEKEQGSGSTSIDLTWKTLYGPISFQVMATSGPSMSVSHLGCTSIRGYSTTNGQPCTNYRPYPQFISVSLGGGGMKHFKNKKVVIWQVGATGLLSPKKTSPSKNTEWFWGGNAGATFRNEKEKRNYELGVSVMHVTQPKDSVGATKRSITVANADGVKYLGDIFGIGISSRVEIFYAKKMSFKDIQIRTDINPFIALKLKSKPWAFRAGVEIRRINNIATGFSSRGRYEKPAGTVSVLLTIQSKTKKR